jgi:acetyl esterase/lipase
MPPCSVPEKWASEYRSWTDNTNDPVLSNDIEEEPYRRFTSILGLEDLTHRLFNPCEDPKGYEGLPKAYIQVAGMDPLRDEGLLYGRLLNEEGNVETKVDIYSGFGHMFWTNYPRMEQSKQYFRDTIRGFQWLLQKDEA